MTCQAHGWNQWHATSLHDAKWSEFRRRSQQRRQAWESESPSETPSEQPLVKGSGHYNTSDSSFHVRCTKVALPLLPMKVLNPETGATVETYALLDSGSNISLCQDRLLESLGAVGHPATMKLTTLEKAGSQAQVKVFRPGGHRSGWERDGRASAGLHMDRPAPQPGQLAFQGELEQWPHLRDLPLHHATIEDVTLLIGQDCLRTDPPTTVPDAWGEAYMIRTCLIWDRQWPVSRSKKLLLHAISFTARALTSSMRKLTSSGVWSLRENSSRRRERPHVTRWYQQRWTRGLKEMPSIRVPRCLQPSCVIEQQVHHLADTLEVAYRVVSYPRITDLTGRMTSTLARQGTARVGEIQGATRPQD